MRQLLDQARLARFLEALGGAAKGPGRVYLTGGATAVWYGWRRTTIDIDCRFDPEPPGVFEAVARLKDELDVNVELASPLDFLPEVPGWRERSRFVQRFGSVDVFQFDPVSQILAKLARGYERDLLDARALVASGLVSPAELAAAFTAVEPLLMRFPRLDAPKFRERVAAFVAQMGGGPTP